MIPAHARLQMEVRGETEEVNGYMRDYVYDIFSGVDKAYRVKSTVTMAGESTTLLQSPELFDKVEEVMKTVPNTTMLPRIHAPSGSEDCACFIRRVIQKGGQAASSFGAATITDTIVRTSTFRTSRACPMPSMSTRVLPER